jgi:hypothetical protein
MHGKSITMGRVTRDQRPMRAEISEQRSVREKPV